MAGHSFIFSFIHNHSFSGILEEKTKKTSVLESIKRSKVALKEIKKTNILNIFLIFVNTTFPIISCISASSVQLLVTTQKETKIIETKICTSDQYVHVLNRDIFRTLSNI